MKLKDDVPFINLIDMGYIYKVTCSTLYCVKKYNLDIVYINTKTRKIEIWDHDRCKFVTPKKYDHCIRDLMLKQYIK